MSMVTALLVAATVTLLLVCGAAGAAVYSRYGMISGVIPLLIGVLIFALAAIFFGS